uniref:Si:ch1073-349o24.2 n=1 Tax=Amphiprion percula TaxID=161767 RepID=A0A3P8SQ41_AMPPE
SCFMGLETRRELVWEDWDLGGEFTKTLVLRNIHKKLQKLPASKCFSTSIAEIIVLSPGTSFSIPVTFRPYQRQGEYEDSIEFQGKEGSFQVCLRAIIPCHVLEVPDSVMLPLCAVQHSSHTNFLLKNAKLQTSFQFECDTPFQLNPKQGMLKPGQECHITVVFQPQEALVYQQHAYCWFGEEGDKAENCCTVLLQALKYPYLQLRNPSSQEEEGWADPVLQFGSVVIGQCLRKHFDIFNPSPTVSFSLSSLSGGIPLLGSVFSCDVTRGNVAPGGSLRATVTYSPAIVNTVSVEYLILKCRGALNEPLLKLTGNCIPKVSLSSSVVDFGCVEEGGSVVQTVKLVNSSPVEAVYKWDIDCNGNSVFSILPASGTLFPQSYTTLKAVYRPTQPITHHRRVACVILHRDPVFLDLTGTSHPKLQKPVILTPEHLSPFSISPSLCDLAPLKSTSFRVTYDPKQLNTLHGAELECFAYYKVGEQLVCPPWCVTVRVIGHSFQPGKGHFIPCCSLKPPQVQTWSFSPLSEKTYTLNPTLIFWPVQTDRSNKSHLTLKVVGMGSKGSIEAEKAVTDIGEILVGSCHSFEVPLVNNSPCPVSFCLIVQETLCEVRAKGVFPTLQVVDACSGGSVGRLSKMHLWKFFSLDSLNEHLLSNPSPAELTFRTPTRHFHSSPSIFTKAILDFNFSSAPLNSDSSNCVLMFYNPGSIPVDTFLFPEDQQIELEYWALTGEFSSTELHQMKHDIVGTHRLPVVLKLSYGREILQLNLQGVTVERDTPYLHFASNQYEFTSVNIGYSSPPRQVYELHNGGAVPVRYQVDMAVLSQLQADNFNHPVLCCLNPEGEVLPGKTTKLEWIFSPLEAKIYMDVPIHIQERDLTLVRFEGCGRDILTPGSSNPLTSSDHKLCVPCVQRVPFPGQILFLSEDSVFLGDIPVCSQSSRILFLTNVSHTDTVHYTWDLPQQSNQQYHDALQSWEEEKERQQDEFTITDKNVTDSQRILIDQEPLAAPARKGPPLRKYKTLPPICASGSFETMGSICTKLTKAERRMQRETSKVWRRPRPPQPALLHLAVTAHSHGLLEYSTHFPDQFNPEKDIVVHILTFL